MFETVIAFLREPFAQKYLTVMTVHCYVLIDNSAFGLPLLITGFESLIMASLPRTEREIVLELDCKIYRS